MTNREGMSDGERAAIREALARHVGSSCVIMLRREAPRMIPAGQGQGAIVPAPIEYAGEIVEVGEDAAWLSSLVPQQPSGERRIVRRLILLRDILALHFVGEVTISGRSRHALDQPS